MQLGCQTFLKYLTCLIIKAFQWYPFEIYLFIYGQYSSEIFSKLYGLVVLVVMVRHFQHLVLK